MARQNFIVFSFFHSSFSIFLLGLSFLSFFQSFICCFSFFIFQSLFSFLQHNNYSVHRLYQWRLIPLTGSHHGGMLPHELAKRHGNMLSVNQEIPEDLVDSGKAVLCPLSAGQMSVSDESVSCRLRCLGCSSRIAYLTLTNTEGMLTYPGERPLI